MRIVLAHPHLAAFGGGERAVLALAAALSQRHEVQLWTGPFVAERTFAALAQFPRRELRPWEWLTATPQADAVVTHALGAHLLALRHPHTICYLHTLRSPYQRIAWRPDYAARRLVERRALHRAAAVLTNSHFSAARAQRLYGLHPEVLSPGVEEAFFATPHQPGSYLLYVGRLAPEKGLERLLAWSADLPYPLLLAGAGAAGYVARLRRLAGPQVRFVGAQEGAALRTLLAGARALAFVPHEEEFGLAALEAMASATPVLAVAEGALPELVRDGVDGILVRSAAEYATAARRLWSDEALCLRLGAAAREAARRHPWQAFVERIEALCAAPVGSVK